MKFLQLIFILLILNHLASAEPQSKRDTTKRDTTKYHIRLISFDQSFRTDTVAVDTSIIKLHILNPVYQSEHSFTHLIRLGYPIMSNYLVSRLQNNDLFFPSNVFPYIQDAKNKSFYDTKKPFTSLSYKNAGKQSNNEECLQVLHTQNLTKKTNIGMSYNLYSSYSIYNTQQSSDHALKIFYRYSGKNYLTYNQYYFNSFKLQENGGIVYDSLVNYKNGVYDGLPVMLQIAASRFKRVGFNSLHELKLKSIFENEDDTLSNDTIPSVDKDYGSILYNFNIESSRRNYTDQYEGSYYKNYFFRTNNSNDSIFLKKISNRLLLNSPNLSKYLPNLRLSLTNDLYYSAIGIPVDTIFVAPGAIKGYNDTLLHAGSKDNFQNTWAGVDVSQKFRQIWWNVVWDIYLLGYSKGDHSVSATANMFLDSAKNIGFMAKASEEMKTPSFFYNKYLSNHFIWINNSFIREKKQTLSAIIMLKKPSISIAANYISLFNYVFFGLDAIPVQTPVSAQLNVFAFSLRSNLNFWKFNTENNLIYQEYSANYFHAPKIIFYNSTTLQHTIHFFTGGKLFFRLGFDFYYHSKYYPDAYNPAVGAFYLQNTSEYGNYPQLDLHLTVKIKTVSFFVKYAHANAGFKGPRQFTAEHYPMLPAVFSYGINWLFYD